MTVGIAAICQFQPPKDESGVLPPMEPIVIMASDRKITSGQREYEQANQTKSFPMSSLITVLVSGYGDDLLEICYRTSVKFNARSITRVDETAALVADEFRDYRNGQNERRVLAPFGLSFESFYKRMREFDQEFTRQRLDELNSWEYDIGTALVVGVDDTGGHIYEVTDPGVSRTCDQGGFATIGSGGKFAEPTFMGVGYTGFFSWELALVLVYTAKKRAEVAAGVGQATDLQWVTRRGGRAYFGPMDPFVQKLDKIYTDRAQAETNAMWEDHAKLLTLLQETSEAPETDDATEQDERASA